MSLTGIELFAGMGVSLTGLKQSGINMIEAYERDTDPAMSLRKNHNDVLVREHDIFDISFARNDSDTLIFPYDKTWMSTFDEQLKENGLTREQFIKMMMDGSLVISGGPPCQPYSALNQKKDPNDPRIQAVEEFIRIVEELKPEYVVFENIPRIFTYIKVWIIKTLKEMGYNIHEGYHSSEKYGDPQVRNRWILIASKRGFVVPQETHGKGLLPYTPAKVFLGEPDDPTEIGITQKKLDEINHLLKINNYNLANWTNFEGSKWETVHVVDASKPIKAVTNPTKLYYMYYDPKTRKVVRKLNFAELKGAFGLKKTYKIHGGNSSVAQQLANSNTVGTCQAIGKAILKNYGKYY